MEHYMYTLSWKSLEHGQHGSVVSNSLDTLYEVYHAMHNYMFSQHIDEVKWWLRDCYGSTIALPDHPKG